MPIASARCRCLRVLLALLLCPLAAAAQTELTESQAKASALFNFARYVEWPERAFAGKDSSFVFCIAGRDGLAAVAPALEGRQMHQRGTLVRRALGVEDLRGCQVLYIGEAEERRIAPFLRAVAAEPVLSVSDWAGFTDAGGGIVIALDEGRIRFDINRQALERAQLRASSNLLRLARNTRQP